MPKDIGGILKFLLAGAFALGVIAGMLLLILIKAIIQLGD
jgi:hypothetical protein